MRLKDKVCLVTGAANGIGWATVEKFVAEGAIVYGCDLNDYDVSELGERAHSAAVNVIDRYSVEEWVESVIAAEGRIDVLVNNAGITRDAQLIKVKDGEVIGGMSEKHFDSVMDVNLKGVFHCTQVVVPHMIKQQSGVILSASSVVAQDGNFGQTNYAATKAGVIAMTQVWSRELGRYGIRANAVLPGFTETAMTAKIPEQIYKTILSHVPLKRAGKPSDIANAYAFLASDEASFINGTTLRVDGGAVNGT